MHAILYPRIKHVLKQGMKIMTVSVHRKWDMLVTYWLTLVCWSKTLKKKGDLIFMLDSQQKGFIVQKADRESKIASLSKNSRKI